MEDNSEREDIANRLAFRGQILDVNDLRGYKAWGPTSCVDIVLFVTERT